VRFGTAIGDVEDLIIDVGKCVQGYSDHIYVNVNLLHKYTYIDLEFT